MKPRKPIKKRTKKEIKDRKASGKWKTLVKSPIMTKKRAYKEAEASWKAACRRRDKSCRIPGCGSIEVIQIDHAFSRQIKQLFLDPRNGTALCRSHHSMKTFHQRGIDKVVDDVVKKREGLEFWNYALQIAAEKKDYRPTIEELEHTKKVLDSLYAEED